MAANASDLSIALLGDSGSTCPGQHNAYVIPLRFKLGGRPILSADLSADAGAGTCGEGTDRISLDLPGVQMQLLAALVALKKPLMVILVHGRPVTFGPGGNVLLDGVDVLLASWIGELASTRRKRRKRRKGYASVRF